MVKSLREDGYTLIAAELNGTEEPSTLSHQEKLLLALGNEASGLSQLLLDLADHHLRIPIAQGKVESLNVSACGAILMYLASTYGAKD